MGSSSNSACCCPSSTVFLKTLADKLFLMTQSLKTQFADLEANGMGTRITSRGVLLANISIQTSLQFKPEYFIYIMRYGPPVNGIFDPVYLELIRIEIANETAL
jgi:hypothetical protein